MGSRREEERNEKVIRGLMKLPPNRRCINCNSVGPQYVCTNFLTFICSTCSGIHREFTHRVKSVSMAKFTSQEVQALQQGGNQRARDIYLTNWDWSRMRLPDNSNPDRVREFIKSVYVDKKYAGGKSSDKAPGDSEGIKNNDKDLRRPDSYHSYSQSPPYDYQYEDRRYGKQAGMLARRPGSDRSLLEGKVTNFLFSPGRLREQMYEDRFANESSGSRFSDFSASSTGDPYRNDVQSPSSQDTWHSSPPVHHARNVLVENHQSQLSNRHSAAAQMEFDVVRRPQRTASSSSFGSLDGSSMSRKSVDSATDVNAEQLRQYAGTQHTGASSMRPSQQQFASLPPSRSFGASGSNSMPRKSIDVGSFPSSPREPVQRTGIQQVVSVQPKAAAHSTNQDLFNQSTMQQSMTTSSIDLFAGFNNQPSTASQESVGSRINADATKALVHDNVIQNRAASALPPSVQPLASLHSTNQKILNESTLQAPVTSPSIDLFAGVEHPSSIPNVQHNPSTIASSSNEGWATFDTVQHALPVINSNAHPQAPVSFQPPSGSLTSNQAPVSYQPMQAPGSFTHTQALVSFAPTEAPVSFPPTEGISQTVNPLVLTSSAQNQLVPETSTPSSNQWRYGAQESISSMTSQTSQSWNAFGDSRSMPYNLPGINHETEVPSQELTIPTGPYAGHGTPKDLARGELERSNLGDTFPGFNTIPDNRVGSPFPASLQPIVGVTPPAVKSTNPFDMPYESELETNNAFMDMSALHSALPNGQVPANYPGNLTQAWFPQNAAVPYLPSVPQGGLPYMEGQMPNPQMLNVPPQGPFPSRNPFDE